MYGRTREDGHADLGNAVAGNYSGYYPAGDHERPAGTEDAAV